MLKKLSLVPVLLTGNLVFSFISGVSIGTSIASLGLSALYAYSLFLQQKKEPKANQDLVDRITLLEEKLSRTDNRLGAISLSHQYRTK